MYLTMQILTKMLAYFTTNDDVKKYASLTSPSIHKFLVPHYMSTQYANTILILWFMQAPLPCERLDWSRFHKQAVCFFCSYIPRKTVNYSIQFDMSTGELAVNFS